MKSLACLHLKSGNINQGLTLVSQHKKYMNGFVFQNVAEELLTEPALLASFSFVANLDWFDDCKEFVFHSNPIKLRDAHRNHFFHVLLNCEAEGVYIITDLPHAKTRKSELFEEIKKITDPLLKIEVLLYALSSEVSGTFIGAFYHIETGQFAPSLNREGSMLHQLACELQTEIQKITQQEALSFEHPLLKNQLTKYKRTFRLSNILTQDEAFICDIKKFSLPLYQNLLKAVGIDPAAEFLKEKSFSKTLAKIGNATIEGIGSVAKGTAQLATSATQAATDLAREAKQDLASIFENQEVRDEDYYDRMHPL